MAQFRTAYDQRAVPFEAAVVAVDGARETAIHRGDFVVYTPATATVVAYISKASTVADATHIVALTDQTVSNGFVRTDNRDYKSSELVSATTEETPTTTTAETKKIALYPIFDKNDVIADASGNDLKS